MDALFTHASEQILGGIRIDFLTVLTSLLFLSLAMYAFAKIQNFLDRPPSCEDSTGELDDLAERAEWHEGSAKGDVLKSVYRRKVRELAESKNCDGM